MNQPTVRRRSIPASLGIVAACLAAVLFAGCYHTTVDVQPVAQPVELIPHYTVQENWVPTWVFGLVPARTIDAATRCPDGVLRVETLHSFLNQLVGALTWGIFTPVTVRLTCRSGSGATN